MTLVAQPVLSGAPWTALKKAPDTFRREDVEIYAYRQGEGEAAAFDGLKALRTRGSVIQGQDDSGAPVACVKLDKNKLPEGLDITAMLRMPSPQEHQLLYAVPKLPPQRYHAELPGHRHLLVVYTQTRDETAFLDRLEESGLFDRHQRDYPPLRYAKNGGMFVALEVPDALMQALARTSDNHITELSTQLAGLSGKQQRDLERGAIGKERLLYLAAEFLAPPEKEAAKSPVEGRERRPSSAATQAPPRMLSEDVDALQAAGLVFAQKRKPDGGVQELLVGLSPQVYAMLTKAQDGLRPAGTVEEKTYALADADAVRLKQLLGEAHYRQEEGVRPAALPKSFFSKYRTLIAEDAEGQRYLYMTPKTQARLTQPEAVLAAKAMRSDLISNGLQAYAGAESLVVVTGLDASAPVLRVPLEQQVAEDLKAQQEAREQAKTSGRVTHDISSGLTREALDGEVQQAFGVVPLLRAGAATVVATHAAAVGDAPSEVEKSRRTAQEGKAAALKAIGLQPVDTMLMIPVTKNGQAQHCLVWRTRITSMSALPSDDAHIQAERKFNRTLAALGPVHLVGAGLRQPPKNLWAVDMDSATAQEVLAAYPEIRMAAEHELPPNTNSLGKFAKEHFDQRDREKEAERADPYMAALGHLAGRNVLAVNVRHPDASEVRTMIASLSEGEVAQAFSALSALPSAAGEAVGKMEALMARLGHLPEAQAELQGSQRSIGTASSHAASAQQQRSAVLARLEGYRTWVEQHQPEVLGTVPQLVVMNPNANTLALLGAPEVRAHMIRAPEHLENLARGQSAMVLYPDKELLAGYRQTQGGMLSYMGGTIKAVQAASLPGMIRSRLAVDTSRETESVAVGTVAEPRVFDGVFAKLAGLEEAKPLLMIEEPTPPDNKRVKAQEEIGARAVLVFKVPQSSQRRKQLAEALEACLPFTGGRKYFGGVENMPPELPEMSEQEKKYYDLFQQEKALEQKRDNDKAHGGTAEVSIRSEIAGLRNAMWDMEEAHEIRMPVIHAHEEAHLEGGVDMVVVHRDEHRVYGLSGQGYATPTDALRGAAQEEYVKIYLEDALAQACRDTLKSRSSVVLRNFSRNGNDLQPVPEQDLAKRVTAMLEAQPVR